MDSGVHYIGSVGPDGLLRRLLEELNIFEALNATVCTPDTVDHVRFSEPAFEFSFPQGWEAMEKGLCDAFPTDSPGLTRFLAEVKGFWEQSRTAFIRDRGRSLDTLFSGGQCSLREAIGRCTTNPLLAAVLSCHAVLYGGSADETSLAFHSQIVGSYYESAGLIEGGGRVWVKAFEQSLRDAGVEVICGQKVSRIHLNDRREFDGIELEAGKRLQASRCISTVHPKRMLEMMPPSAFTTAFRRRIRGLVETPSAVVLFGRCPSASFAGNLILANEPRAIENWACTPLEERPIFVSVPTDHDNSGVSVICPSTLADTPVDGSSARPEGYRQWKRQVTDRIVQRLSRCADDLLGGFEPLDVATPLTFRDRLSSPEGGLYGVKHRLEDMPLLPRTTAKGLYLSGQAVVAPGVLGALCAGFLTESCIV
jgi:all-trans-retinol 13,14-reductase